MEWKIETAPINYETALEAMQTRVAAIQQGQAEELCWLLEHPPLYTAGTSARADDLLWAKFPVYETGRGGQYTYHGPGQRVAYLLRDLKKHSGGKVPDVRAYVRQLERWIMLTLAEFGVEGFTRDGRIGVWVDVGAELAKHGRDARQREPLAAGVTPDLIRGKEGQAPLQQEAKIAALGVRLQRGVTSHGIAINVHPDLSHYAGIVPCGISEYGVTSLKALGIEAGLSEADAALKRNFRTVFEA